MIAELEIDQERRCFDEVLGFTSIEKEAAILARIAVRSGEYLHENDPRKIRRTATYMQGGSAHIFSADYLTHDMRVLRKAVELHSEGLTNDALDLLCIHLDELLYDGAFARVDEFLLRVSIEKVALPLMLTCLTITVPSKSRLRARDKFVARCRKELESRGENVEELIRGLE